MKNILTMLISLSLIGFAGTAQAATKIAQCSLDMGGEIDRGKCKFESFEGGSFIVSNPSSGRGFLSNTDFEAISVDVYAKGKADVMAVMKSGTRIHWGDAVRSTSDRACWYVIDGADIEICAR